MKSFGHTIRELRTARKLTQRALAAQVGINFTYLSKIENNRLEPGQSPKKDTIARLAEALDTDADELLLLARKIPDAISEQIMERPALFRKIACLDDEKVDRLLEGLNNGKKQEPMPKLGHSESFLQSILDSLSCHIAVLDEDGRIMAVNAAWQRFAARNGMDPEECGLGADYLAICDAATGLGSDGSEVAADAIREVLRGEREHFEMEYPCHSMAEKRWFILRVTSFEQNGASRAVVSHDNVTIGQLAGIES